MNDEAVAGDELGQLLGDRGKRRMLGEEFGVEPMYRHGVRRDIALGVDVTMQLAAGRDVVDQFETGDLDDPVARLWIKSGGFGIDHDLAHGFTPDETAAAPPAAAF